jgi:hypothetical protein
MNLIDLAQEKGLEPKSWTLYESRSLRDPKSNKYNSCRTVIAKPLNFRIFSAINRNLTEFI